jgi:hypothetical protein
MQEPLFIGAGTKGAKKIGNAFQPFMDFHGKACLEYVVEAAMAAERVGDIYLWGNKAKLEKLLKEYRKNYRGKIIIVEERDNIAESFFFTFLNYITSESEVLDDIVANWRSIRDINWNQLQKRFKKTPFWEIQVDIITSDTPLISAYEIDYLIRNKNHDADIVLGRTVRKDYKTILEKLDAFPDREKSVKNFYTYRVGDNDVPMIVNSYMAGKPFKLNENIWNIINSFYENRTIIAGRKKNLRKIAKNLLFFKRLFFPKQNGTEGHTYTEKAKAAFYLVNAYKSIVKSKNASVYYRDLRKIYRSIDTLVDLTIECNLSHCFGSAFDIDTPYEADFIRKNFSRLQGICTEYYKTHTGPRL